MNILSPSILAADFSRLGEQIREAEQQHEETEEKLDETEENLKGLNEQHSSLQGTLSTLNTELTQVSNNLNELEGQIAEKEEEIDDLEKQIAQVEEELAEAIALKDEQYTTMKKQIQFTYERSSNLYMELFFSSGSLSDFLNKNEYIEQLSAYQKKVLDEYKSGRRRRWNRSRKNWSWRKRSRRKQGRAG